MEIYRIWIDKFKAINLITREFTYGDGLKEGISQESAPHWRDKFGWIRSLICARMRDLIPGSMRDTPSRLSAEDRIAYNGYELD